MTIREVEEVFGGITCPYCHTKISAFRTDVDPGRQFTSFRSEGPATQPGCARFDRLLNERLFAFRAGMAKRAEIDNWLAPYRIG